ncbi:hypothetical protein D3C76_523620 [compost metagenome]
MGGAHPDTADRTIRHAGTTAIARLGMDAGGGYSPQLRRKTDGLLLAAVLTALAEDLGTGQATGFDVSHIVPGRLGRRPEHRHLAGADAFTTEGALATLEIHRREAAVPLDQDLLRAGRQAVATPGAIGHEVGPGDRPRQLHLGSGRTQSSSKQTAA